MKKIIVTGGNGFIGSNLIKFLLNKNFFVINIDKNAYSKTSYILKDINKKKFYFLQIGHQQQKKSFKYTKKI